MNYIEHLQSPCEVVMREWRHKHNRGMGKKQAFTPVLPLLALIFTLSPFQLGTSSTNVGTGALSEC